MFDVEVLSKRLAEVHEIELLGKTYTIKNCVRILEKDIIKLCAVLEADNSEITVFIDAREYPQGAKNE